MLGDGARGRSHRKLYGDSFADPTFSSTPPPSAPSPPLHLQPTSMASGPHDIVSSVDGSTVRYKVYPEKQRKSKIKLCVRFDPDNPLPEREWDQFRDDGDPEAAVRAAARRLLGGSAPTESVELARAASEQMVTDRRAAAIQEARELQKWHAEKAAREAEQQARHDAETAERAARLEEQQAKRQKTLQEKREVEAHAACDAYHRGLSRGIEEAKKTLQVVDAYKETLSRLCTAPSTWT